MGGPGEQSRWRSSLRSSWLGWCGATWLAERFNREPDPREESRTWRSSPRPSRSRRRPSHLEKGKYGPIFPKTPACYGFTIIAKVKPGRAEAIRNYGPKIAKALEADPHMLAPLKLHYLRWVLFDNDTRFMYQGIFDTDFDKYTEDAVVLFRKSGVDTVFENLEGFPDGLEDEPRGVRQVRPGAPVPELHGVRRVPVRHARRDQEGPEDQGTPSPRCSSRCSRPASRQWIDEPGETT